MFVGTKTLERKVKKMDRESEELLRRFETAIRLAAAKAEPLTKVVTMDAQAILKLIKELEAKTNV